MTRLTGGGAVLGTQVGLTRPPRPLISVILIELAVSLALFFQGALRADWAGYVLGGIVGSLTAFCHHELGSRGKRISPDRSVQNPKFDRIVGVADRQTTCGACSWPSTVRAVVAGLGDKTRMRQNAVGGGAATVWRSNGRT